MERYDSCYKEDMTRSVCTGGSRTETSANGLIREIADPSLRKVRNRVVANSLTELRNLFFRGEPRSKEKTEGCDPSET